MPGILTMISAPNTSTETVGFLNQVSNIADSPIKKLQGRYINPTMLLDQREGNSHLRLWHIADVSLGLTNVRFWGQSGHGPTAAYQSRFMSIRPSL